MKQLSTRADSDRGPEAAGGRRLVLEAFLPYRLVMLADQVSQSLARLYGRRHGITNPEWRTLAALGQFGTMTATGVGRHSRMHKTKVSRAVAELERKGLIARTPSADDLRVADLALTPKGRELYDELVPLALAFAERLAEGLDAKERAALEQALTTLMARAEAIARDLEQADGASGP